MFGKVVKSASRTEFANFFPVRRLLSSVVSWRKISKLLRWLYSSFSHVKRRWGTHAYTSHRRSWARTEHDSQPLLHLWRASKNWRCVHDRSEIYRLLMNASERDNNANLIWFLGYQDRKCFRFFFKTLYFTAQLSLRGLFSKWIMLDGCILLFLHISLKIGTLK